MLPEVDSRKVSHASGAWQGSKIFSSFGVTPALLLLTKLNTVIVNKRRIFTVSRPTFIEQAHRVNLELSHNSITVQLLYNRPTSAQKPTTLSTTVATVPPIWTFIRLEVGKD